MVSGLITLWQIDGGKVKAVEEEIFFFFLGFLLNRKVSYMKRINSSRNILYEKKQLNLC